MNALKTWIFEPEEDLKKAKLPSGRKNPLYQRWFGMMDRCYNEGRKSYKHYGATGIRVCQEWHDKQVFFKWRLEQPEIYELGGLAEIDRIDPDGNYSPDNCRFVHWMDNKKRIRMTKKTLAAVMVNIKKAAMVNRKPVQNSNGEWYESARQALRAFNRGTPGELSRAIKCNLNFLGLKWSFA